MTEPDPAELLTVSTPYALHAVTEAEAIEIERQLVAAPGDVTNAFINEVRAVRETMAVVSAATALEPPPRLRTRLLDAVTQSVSESQIGRSSRSVGNRWQKVALAAAAVIAVGLGALGIGMAIRPAAPPPSAAAQVLAAPDVRAVSGPVTSSGTATLMFSRERNAGVLVMNNVVPPNTGSVYQMWLVGADGARSAGIIDAASIVPSTKAVLTNLDDSKVLAFTVEPTGGSAQPTTPIFAKLALAQ
jgi:anti-sigma-K factor RskA